MMSKEMTKNELIDELDRISSLYDRRLDLFDMIRRDSELYDLEVKESAENFVKKTMAFQEARIGTLDAKRPKISQFFFKAPPDLPEFANKKNSANDILRAAITGLVMLATMIIFGLYIAGVSLEKLVGPGLTFLFMAVDLALLIASMYFWFKKESQLINDIKKWKNDGKEWETKRAEWITEYNTKSAKEENDRFLNELLNYDSAFRKFVKACDEKYEEEFELYTQNNSDILKKHQDEVDKYNAEIAETEKQLDEVTLIHSDMFDYAEDIASMLKIGRADSLKEAINLVFDEERKDNEEAARRREAAQQRAVLEQQAEDNRMHNEAMLHIEEQKEKEMREHNAAMERAANAQAEAMKSQAKAMESQAKTQAEMAKRQEKSGVSRCYACAHRGHCSAQGGSSGINCPGFRPR